MIFFGHLGIGSKLVSPWSKGLPRKWLLFGTVLPDVVDKTVYYGLSFATGKHGAELGLISGTRTFGHSAIALLAVSLASVATRSRALAALSLGIASHLVLDNTLDRFLHSDYSSAFQALVWPLAGGFAVYPFSSIGGHFATILQPPLWGSEIAGALILFWDEWKIRNQRDFLQSVRVAIRERRFRFRRRKR